ncbi:MULTISPECIES: 6-phosphogluconolactonase [unclassified Corynebacterium]|uniref:6-phosphogluconolactonase n=1 Tax=unclassified Corynebacterium TaxID=2624378 RepID=UPI0029CA3B45|nr:MULTISPECIES: 6-phosphogluconolactonase [unclassified Corynebacterium]WPF65134.1 6-phosphogluconolactonase [Corynebacterium sp. 22KM0430]WPF67630.1 6-phosphogluconolactonase [Corynebacterium sp. 21KM1197]
MADIQRYKDLPALVAAAAEGVAEVVREAQGRGDGTARLVLTGGGAGIALLESLREREDIAWERVHVFFGDERNVPVNDPESNEGQARAALLGSVAIPPENVHGMGLSGEASLEEAARRYEQIVERYAPEGFDLHLLGMGGEGHINSLFPHSEATAEKRRLVVAVHDSPKPPAQRLSLTLPAIGRARRVWLLVSGAAKAEAAAAVANNESAMLWPAAGARGVAETILFLDEEAASLL